MRSIRLTHPDRWGRHRPFSLVSVPESDDLSDVSAHDTVDVRSLSGGDARDGATDMIALNRCARHADVLALDAVDVRSLSGGDGRDGDTDMIALNHRYAHADVLAHNTGLELPALEVLDERPARGPDSSGHVAVSSEKL